MPTDPTGKVVRTKRRGYKEIRDLLWVAYGAGNSDGKQGLSLVTHTVNKILYYEEQHGPEGIADVLKYWSEKHPELMSDAD